MFSFEAKRLSPALWEPLAKLTDGVSNRLLLYAHWVGVNPCGGLCAQFLVTHRAVSVSGGVGKGVDAEFDVGGALSNDAVGNLAICVRL